MKIGIFYATYSGGTQMASEFLAEKLKSLGHEVTLKQISEISFDETLTYDLRVFTSPSWDNESEEGQPHIDFISFIQKSAGKNFSGKPCAVFGLGDSTYAHFCGAVDIVTDYIKKNGGKIIINPLKIDGYLFNTEANNKLLSDWASKLKV